MLAKLDKNKPIPVLFRRGDWAQYARASALHAAEPGPRCCKAPNPYVGFGAFLSHAVLAKKYSSKIFFVIRIAQLMLCVH